MQYCWNTLKEFLQQTTDAFVKSKLYFGHGTDNPWDEAVAIAIHVLNLSPNVSQSMLSYIPSIQEKSALEALAQQRIATKKPLPYLTNISWFAGSKYYVNEHVLIPRSPIAELLQRKCQPWLKKSPKKILDIGTGSGCLAILAAKCFPEARVDAIDISPAAIEVAKINISQHNCHAVKLICQDAVKFLKNHTKYTDTPSNDTKYTDKPKHDPKYTDIFSYDLIISNPPYVNQHEMRTLPTEYRSEPKLALSSGKDGLDFCKAVLPLLANVTNDTSLVIIEVGNQKNALMQAFPKLTMHWPKLICGGMGVAVIPNFKCLAAHIN